MRVLRRGPETMLVVAVLVVYGTVCFQVLRSTYSLVNDYIAFSLTHGGWWPGTIADSLLHPFSADSWLYRPFADAASWILLSLFRDHVGLWRAFNILLRFASVLFVWAAVHEFTRSGPVGAAAAAYFAFFPAIPELELIRVESLLTPLVALTFLGLVRLARDRCSGVGLVATCLCFVAATMTKEVVAPLLLAMLVLVAPLMWARGARWRIALGVMLAAVAKQSVHMALSIRDPYAGAGEPRFVSRVFEQTRWVAETLTLWKSSVFPVSLALAVLILLGLWALWNRRDALGRIALVLAPISVAMAMAAPYPALRYLVPAAIVCPVVLAAGLESTLRSLHVRDGRWLSGGLLLVLACSGGTQQIAQAVAMKTSTLADWQMLRYVAASYRAGRSIYMIESRDFERAFWVRAELVGVDPRYDFVAFVAERTARGQKIEWPPPPRKPVNLTGLVPEHPTGRFETVSLPHHFEPGAVVITANPNTPSVPAEVVPGPHFEHSGGLLIRTLNFTYSVARRLNPDFEYLYDFGESPFPGHYWSTFVGV